MIYGNVFLPGDVITEKTSNDLFTVESVVYEEYCNRKAILESVSEGEDTSILEAELQILAEVSIKDIIERVKNAWKELKMKIAHIVEVILEKIGKFIKNEKAKKKYNEVVKKIARFFWTAASSSDMADKYKELLAEVKDYAVKNQQITINFEYKSTGTIKERITESDFKNLKSKVESLINPYCDVYMDYQHDFMVEKEKVDQAKTDKVKEYKNKLVDFDVIVEKEDPDFIRHINLGNVGKYLMEQEDLRDKLTDISDENCKYLNDLTDNIKKMMENIDKEINTIPKNTSSSTELSTKIDNNGDVEIVKTYAEHLGLQMNYLSALSNKTQKISAAILGACYYKSNSINDMIVSINNICTKYNANLEKIYKEE